MSRVNLILSLVFLALGGVLLLLEKPWERDRFERAEENRSRPLFPDFDSMKAARIEIRHAASEVILTKGQSGWVLPSASDFKANEEAVARLLDRVRGMNRNDLVSKDKSQHTKYRVAEGEGPRVVVRDGGGIAIADFHQGRPYFNADEIAQFGKISQLDFYIRPEGSDEVFRISPFESVEPVALAYWLPRNLFKFDIAAIQTLMISGSDLSVEVVLNRLPDGTWKLATPGGTQNAKKDAAETAARSFSSMYLTDIAGAYDVADASKYGFNQPRIRVRAELTGGATEELLIGNDADPEYAYALGGIAKKHVAKVTKASLASLRVTHDQLIETPAPASAPAATQPADK